MTGRERVRRERHHRRLQPRPADLPRRAPTARWSRCPAGGGLASSLHRLLAGSGTTWASVTMGAADREAVAQGLMHEDGLDLVPVVVDDDTYRQAYDVVANTTLWYCHHHLFDLPHRPRFDRHWRAAWDGYRAYNQAMADVVVARAGRGRHRAGAGLPLLAARAGCWPSARPDLRTVHFLHTPFADPTMLGVLPDDVRGRAARRHGRLRRLRLPLPPVGGRLRGLLRGGRAGRAGRPSWPRSAPTPTCSRRRRRRRRAPRRPRPCGPRWAGGASSCARDRMEPSKNIVRGMLAFEELLHAHPEWRGEVVHVALAYPSRQGLAEYLAYAADVEHTAERINHVPRGSRTAWTPDRALVDDDWARSLAALTLSDVLLVNPVRDGLNLVAKEGPLLNTADGVLVLSHQAGAWEELLAGPARSGSTPSTSRARPTRCTPRSPCTPAERAQRAAALRAAVRARTSADWWADQLAAAGSAAERRGGAVG